MAIVSLAGDYREIADKLQRAIKGCERTEGVNDRGVPFIALEGEFATFDTYELDMWGGHMRFTLLDHAPKGAEDILQRAELAAMVPSLHGLLTMPTQLTVERLDTITTKVITQKWNDKGRMVSEETAENTTPTWTDVTVEFHKVWQRQAARGWE